jgi:hypothetical protein
MLLGHIFKREMGKRKSIERTYDPTDVCCFPIGDCSDSLRRIDMFRGVMEWWPQWDRNAKHTSEGV